MSERVEFETYGGEPVSIDPAIVCLVEPRGLTVKLGFVGTNQEVDHIYVKGTAAEVEATLQAAEGDGCRETRDRYREACDIYRRFMRTLTRTMRQVLADCSADNHKFARDVLSDMETATKSLLEVDHIALADDAREHGCDSDPKAALADTSADTGPTP